MQGSPISEPISPEGPLGLPPPAFLWPNLTVVLTTHALDAIQDTFSQQSLVSVGRDKGAHRYP